ncbi:hypothetical protein F5Y19DRAFT_432024, partial [Xylariaceae sp. FL1651]
MSAPVALHMTLSALMLETFCARRALAASFDSSDENRFEKMIRDRGTYVAYTPARASAARMPDGSSEDPMMTRSGS